MSLALDKSKQMMIYYISGGGKSALSCERSGTENQAEPINMERTASKTTFPSQIGA